MSFVKKPVEVVKQGIECDGCSVFVDSNNDLDWARITHVDSSGQRQTDRTKHLCGECLRKAAHETFGL